MKKLVLLVLIVLFVSCKKSNPQLRNYVNDNQVVFLFEKDGVKVYRFTDNMNYHYFTSKGEIIK